VRFTLEGHTLPSTYWDLGPGSDGAVLFSMQVVTVNCARIIHGNQVATNGVVHVIDRVVSSVGNSMAQVLDVDDDLTTLAVRKYHTQRERERERERVLS